jgi:hypothetical protein
MGSREFYPPALDIPALRLPRKIMPVEVEFLDEE